MDERKNVKLSDEMLAEYREYLESEEKSGATIEKYMRDVRAFQGYLGEGMLLDREKVHVYKQRLVERYKITSANPMLMAVNSFLVFMGYRKWKVKLFKMQKVQYSRPEREISGKEYKRLVHTTRKQGDEQMSMLLRTIGSTGIRINELKFATVEVLGDGGTGTYNKGKYRMVLLPEELTRLLKRHCKKAGIEAGSAFISGRGNPMDRSNVSKKMKQLGRKAGVSMAEIFSHNLRRLFAGTFYSVEKDVVRLIDLLGHSSINTARVYTMMTEEQPRRRISRMKLVLGQAGIMAKKQHPMM